MDKARIAHLREKVLWSNLFCAEFGRVVADCGRDFDLLELCAYGVLSSAACPPLDIVRGVFAAPSGFVARFAESGRDP